MPESEERHVVDRLSPQDEKGGECVRSRNRLLTIHGHGAKAVGDDGA